MQCKGTTKSGKRCRATVGLVDGYCRLHRDQASTMSQGPQPQAENPRVPSGSGEVESAREEGNLAWTFVVAVASMLLLFAADTLLLGRRRKGGGGVGRKKRWWRLGG